jgi:transcriptional regulator GlxA family with amidase domain
MYVENNWQLRRPEHFAGTSPAQRIAFLLTDSCDLLGIVAIAEALECACSLAPPDASCRYEMLFLSETGGRVKCDGSLVISTDALDVTEKTRFDRVFIATGVGSRAAGDAALRASWLQRMVANGTAVKFLTAGAVTLRADAAAGLREGGGAVDHEQAHRRRAQLQSAMAAASDVIRADFGTY